MSQTSPKYSLWLRPTQLQIDEFCKIISELAHRYRTTPFPPHITLLPRLILELKSVEQACEKIIEQIHSFEIPMQNITYTQEFYRNFFILAEPTFTLTMLHKDFKTELELETNEDFIPHVSLLYGDLDLNTKECLKEELKERYPKKFRCVRLDIYNSTGEIAEWSLVKSYKLHQFKK